MTSKEPKQPVRIAYVVHTFDMGGLERCVARLVNHLDPSRFRPVIICLNRNGDAAGWVERADVPIIELHKRPGNDPRVVWRLCKALRRQQIDIVHSHNWGTLLESVLARKWASVRSHVHAVLGLELENLQIRSWRRRLRDRVAQWALRGVDSIVAVGDEIRTRLITQCGCSQERIWLIAVGVDTPPGVDSQSERVRVRRSLDISEDALVVGSVGRLAPVKDFGTAIEALSLLPNLGPEVHFVVIGNGSEKEPLFAKATAAGVNGNVHLVGRQETIGSWLAAMDLYMNSSLSEGMSLSILEAMAAGLPLAVTDVGENAALVGGVPCCGLIVPPGDPGQLARTWRKLLENPGMRRQFGRCAQERFQQLYSTQRMVTEYEALYSTILLGRHHG